MQIHSHAADAVAAIQSNQKVFIHGGVATPHALIDALVTRITNARSGLEAIEFCHLHTVGKITYLRPEVINRISVSAFFIGENSRQFFHPRHIDYIPCFLSEIPSLIRSDSFKLDVAFIHVSPPDAQGYCTLGTSVDIALAATQKAKLLIAQINPHMPRTHGDGFIHISKIHHAIEINTPIPECPSSVASPDESKIAKNIAQLIENGSTLQMGIGAIPDAVMAELKSHRNLGIHTEMWSDGALALIQSGAVDNSKKKIHPGKTVSAFVMGSKALYDYIDDNPSVVQLDAGYVNNPHVIAKNPKVVAINSAVEIDLTGQVCADSIGSKIISGTGGQIDFIRGATLSTGGKPIIALTSRTKKGASRLVATLKTGAGVVTTRCHVHYVVTEFGVAHLYGKTLGQRAKALIDIAHPDDRENLDKTRSTLFK